MEKPTVWTILLSLNRLLEQEQFASRLVPFLIKPGIRSGHIKDREERNDLILKTLLRNSQAAIKKGLDLRGGVAFTMEITESNQTMDDSSSSGVSPMDKVVEIMNERLNAFGVAETMVRQKGDRSIEIPNTRTLRRNKIPA